MRDIDLFQAALGLSSPWVVLRSDFDPERKQLDLQIGFARGSRFACPARGARGCGVHDVKEKAWRHLNVFQHKTLLKASLPRVSRETCGVKQMALCGFQSDGLFVGLTATIRLSRWCCDHAA